MLSMGSTFNQSYPSPFQSTIMNQAYSMPGYQGMNYPSSPMGAMPGMGLPGQAPTANPFGMTMGSCSPCACPPHGMMPQQPTFYQTPPVMVQQPPIMVQQPPVMVQQPPVMIQQPPVMIQQPPVSPMHGPMMQPGGPMAMPYCPTPGPYQIPNMSFPPSAISQPPAAPAQQMPQMPFIPPQASTQNQSPPVDGAMMLNYLLPILLLLVQNLLNNQKTATPEPAKTQEPIAYPEPTDYQTPVTPPKPATYYGEPAVALPPAPPAYTEPPVYTPPTYTPPAYNGGNGGKYWGDPHLVGFDGEKYDVMGQAGKIYNMLSDKNIQYNTVFEAWGNNGNTVIGKAGIQIGASKVEFDRSGNAPTVDGKAIAVGETVQLDLGGSAAWDGNKLIVTTQEYTIDLEVKDEDHRNGPYLDSNVKINDGGPFSDMVAPHGLLGQTADGIAGKKNTGIDQGKQGGTVIDGTVDDYEVQDLWSDRFKFNRFGAEIGEVIQNAETGLVDRVLDTSGNLLFQSPLSIAA